MQSRLAAVTGRYTWVLSLTRNQVLRQRLASTTSSRTADPAVHAVDHEDGSADPSGEIEKSKDAMEPGNARASVYENSEENYSKTEIKAGQETEPFRPPKPPVSSSPRLVSIGVNQPLDPITQQRRNHTTAIEDVCCAGLDVSPWPSDDKQGREKDAREREEDYKEYYKDHKASPLSEIEVADTRKPITRATDGTAGTAEYGGRGDAIGWRPEQLDTAEEALRRATEIWKENAMRGDPDAPQSRVLRALRGESF